MIIFFIEICLLGVIDDGLSLSFWWFGAQKRVTDDDSI